MYKGLVVSIVLFLLSSGAFGAIGQAEDFNISAKNLVSLLGEPGSASGGNSAIIGQSQSAATEFLDFTIALQSETLVLNQASSAVGLSAILGSTQLSGIIGQQVQTADSESSAQKQDQAINLVQDTIKTGGIGGIIAGQGAIIGQSQIIATPNGINVDSQFAGVSQFGGIGGGAGSSATIDKDLTVGAGQ